MNTRNTGSPDAERGTTTEITPPPSTRARPWRFLGLTLGLTWALGFLAAGIQGVAPPWAITGLRFAGGLMPLAVAAALTHLVHAPDFRRDFWRRLIDVRRIGVVWLAVIFLYTPVKSSLAALIDFLLGGQGMAPEAITGLLAQPLSIVPTLVFWLLFGPVPEEPGWRGYALDGLQARRSALASSLIVGSVWAVWHLPLFFIEGTWQAEEVGLGTQRFWLFMLTIVVESVLYTWIFNHTDRSTLAAVLFHFTGNAFGELFELTARAEVLSFAIAVAATVAVVLIWGPQRLSRRRETLIPA